MKSVIFVCMLGVVACQNRFVWDLLKPPLNAADVLAILSTARADGSAYPMYDMIPETNFQCGSKRQAGFYADADTGCQVFHRCDINGNHTRFLCVNTTVFNQITLTCDYFFNVDCLSFAQYEDLANSRLYSDLPLFDSPPTDYIPLYLQQQAQTGVQPGQGGGQSGQNVVQSTCPVMKQRCSPKMSLCRRDSECGSGRKCCQMDCNVRKCL